MHHVGHDISHSTRLELLNIPSRQQVLRCAIDSGKNHGKAWPGLINTMLKCGNRESRHTQVSWRKTAMGISPGRRWHPKQKKNTRAVPRPPGRCEFSSHGASMMTIWTCLTKARKAVQGQSEWLENVPMLNEPYRLTIWLFNIAMENHHL